MDSLQHKLARLELSLASLLLVIIVVLVFFAAVSRYWGTPVNWSIDAAQGLFVWVVFLGASQALRTRRHLGVDLFVTRLGPRSQAIINLLLNLIIVAFLGGILVFGVQLSIVNYNRQFPSFPLSYSYVTIAASVGSGLMLITKLVEIAGFFLAGRKRHAE